MTTLCCIHLVQIWTFMCQEVCFSFYHSVLICSLNILFLNLKIKLLIHIWLLDIDVDMGHSFGETRLNVSTDDTLEEDGSNCCNAPQGIHESENEWLWRIFK